MKLKKHDYSKAKQKYSVEEIASIRLLDFDSFNNDEDSDDKPISEKDLHLIKIDEDDPHEKGIPKWAILEIRSIISDPFIDDCNEVADKITELMTYLGFEELGCGTNRIAFRKGQDCYKIALDNRGKIDNVSEYRRSKEHPEVFAKTWECLETKEIINCEYCELIEFAQFYERREEARRILKYISNTYVFDDIGITSKNFCNWGLRYNYKTGESDLVIIDYAYTYPKNSDYRLTTCDCGGEIKPNADFTGYACDNATCRRSYTVDDLLERCKIDFDSDAILVQSEEDPTVYTKVSGSDFGETSEMVLTENEAEDMVEKFIRLQQENTKAPDARDALEVFGTELTTSSKSSDDYVPLSISDFI